MKRIGLLHCTHKEVAGSPGQVVVTFRASEKHFGGTLILRVEDVANEYEIGKDYPLSLGPGQEAAKPTPR